MNEMIERVAKALWEADRQRIPANAEMPHWDDGQMGEYHRESLRLQARAAIEAMRTPTAAISRINGSVNWPEMIDAALKNDTPPEPKTQATSI